MNPTNAHTRADVIKRIRAFFEKYGVLEVETPLLSAGAIADRHINLFTVSSPDKIPRYLQSSPEQHMKRLLCEGYPDIFQIARVFRSGESGAHHNPEFTMLEWYRRGFSMMQLIDEIGELCIAVLGPRIIEKVAYRDMVMKHTGLDISEVDRRQVIKHLEKRAPVPSGLDTLTDALQYLFMAEVEPKLLQGNLVFVHSYPAQQAVLAKISPEDARAALRFELFCGGMELANGWEELADAEQNAARADFENRERIRLGKPQVPVHPAFIDGLRKGLPACSGVALGVDRLVMLAAGTKNINDVLAFPWDEA